MQRERLGTRLGFILVSAGCAIGLGNIWRFPWMVGEYGGAFFVLIYVAFIVLLGVPVMTAEFTVGRGSRKSVAESFQVLQPHGGKWHLFSYVAMAGNYLLMMFYTTIVGWVIYYLYKMIKGDFIGLSPDEVGGVLGATLGSPGISVGFMFLTCILGFLTCILGLQKGVERVTKFMMGCFFVFLVILVVRALTLPPQPGVETTALDGLRFLFIPDMTATLAKHGIGAITFAALGQAFFSLSIGMGSMAIFGSYLGRERRLAGESVFIAGTDTLVSFCSGLLIFPLCFAFGTDPGSGFGLLFVTVPNIFAHMAGGYFWGILFFVFMVFATLTTVIAVFENIVAFAMDLGNWTRQKAVVVNMIAVPILSIPCALGFNIWAEPLAPFLSWLGEGSIVIDLWDFIVSQNVLPIGGAIYMLFCMTKSGWGYDNFLDEANAGEGMRFPTNLKWYFTYVIPTVICIVFIAGYLQKFWPHLMPF
jgi:NSS family neurotransmitter:Na+ symporter